MLAFIQSCGLSGIEGFAVTVEVNHARGMPLFEIVGLPDASVKESRERVRAALRNSGFGFPAERLTVNLAPADQKKEGPAFDLPIALGTLCCMGLIPLRALKEVCVFGELSLDGGVRPVQCLRPCRGILSDLLGQGDEIEIPPPRQPFPDRETGGARRAVDEDFRHIRSLPFGILFQSVCIIIRVFPLPVKWFRETKPPADENRESSQRRGERRGRNWTEAPRGRLDIRSPGVL